MQIGLDHPNHRDQTKEIRIIPKIKDWVFNSEDFKEGIQSFVERAVFRGQ